MSNHILNTAIQQQIIDKQSELLRTGDALNKAQAELIKSQASQIIHLQESYDFVITQLEALKRIVFGSKSEKYIDPESNQPSLLDEDNLFSNADTQGAQISESDIKVAAHTRKKKPKSTKALTRRVEVIHIPESEMTCSCGACKRVIRTESKELINYIPAKFEIIEQHREIAACPVCQEGVVIAPAPLQILPKVGVTEEFLSNIIVSKLEDRQPLYHLEKKLLEYGVDCSRQNMARWFIDLAEPLRPIYNLLKDMILEYDIGGCDATSLQVLKEPGRCAQTKSDVYCFRGGSPGKAVILYDYNAQNHKEFIRNWFTGFNGYLHVDADNCFDILSSNGVALSYCNAHARRNFEPIAKASKAQGVAKQAMLYYKELYKIEREAKDKELTHQQRHTLRQEKSKPIVEELNSWLAEIQPTVLPQSALGKAVNYAVKHRESLMQFLNDGRLEIDNNLTEQAIKPLVIARKNFMFCNSVAGAHALCLHFGLIRTAKLHGLEPYQYYVTLLKKIPYCQTVDDYEKLLPWNIALA